MQAPNRLYKSEVGGSVSRVKTPLRRDYLIARTCYKQSNAFLMRRGEAQFPHGTWTHCEAPTCVESAVHAVFRAEEFPLLCLTPKVMPRFSLGDAGEARWPLSHRWTDTSPILPDAEHNSRNQSRVVSLPVLSLLWACVRLCHLREVHHNLHQALNPWSRTQSAATDGPPACCTSSLMVRALSLIHI